MTKLDPSSTDAMHWAEHFCKTLNKISEDHIDLDVGWVQGWFANYWAAVHDPLQTRIDGLEASIRSAKNELGVPTENYPAPVANAVEILSRAVKE